MTAPGGKITNCLISGRDGYPIYIDDDNAIVQNNIIRNNYYDVYIASDNAIFTGNTINMADDDSTAATAWRCTVTTFR